jgi:hypothetical protein
MANEEGSCRFFAVMDLFIGFMLIVVLAGDLLVALCRMGRRRALQLLIDRLSIIKIPTRSGRLKSLYRHANRRRGIHDRSVFSGRPLGDP